MEVSLIVFCHAFDARSHSIVHFSLSLSDALPSLPSHKYLSHPNLKSMLLFAFFDDIENCSQTCEIENNKYLSNQYCYSIRVIENWISIFIFFLFFWRYINDYQPFYLGSMSRKSLHSIIWTFLAFELRVFFLLEITNSEWYISTRGLLISCI